jgi:F0F1-type ATP synthase assembly protein I
MPEIDGLKEETAYLKLLLGILIVTGISLIGWLLRNFGTASWPLIGSGFIGLLVIGFGCFVLHQRIESKIDEIRKS